MSNQPPSTHDPLPISIPNEIESFSTLKQSLSASLASNTPLESHSTGFSQESLPIDHVYEKRLLPPHKPNGNVQPRPIDFPVVSSAADTALAALKYLPTPLLVLSSLKTILLANEAMGRLLGLENFLGSLDEDDNELEIDKLLQGQTLSQIGVDILQGGQPIWVSWDVRHAQFGNMGRN